ncbi:hypothetical protein ECDEC13B_2848 [Escherichia coli DEC13B]|nr:hypothetical protein ECDEC13B_2848 [Escherichia coli DEC13B]EHX71774.1 hypothetical protein ECDEC13E_3191 [Escherichia coli DEC13E]
MFPAPAGINRDCGSKSPAHVRVPRASGDKPAAPHWRWHGMQCSPRQRG